MNAALLMMSSAWMAGADATPPPPPPPVAHAAPVAVGHGCSNCGPVYHDACCDPCGGKGGLFSRFRSGGGLFSRFKKGGDCCAPPCDTCGHAGVGCALPAVPGTVPPPVLKDPPKDMPKPPSTTAPKTGTSASVITIPAPPVTPVSGPLGGTTNPY